MVAIVLIHMIQVFLFGAYKYPRELTWIVGVFLLLITLGMAFTGQVLRFDQDAYWGLGIGASIASRVPFLGPPIVTLMLGGPIIAGATLSRFFALHVFVIPGLLIAFVCVHLLMVVKLGINEWPMPGRLVRKALILRTTTNSRKRTVCRSFRARFGKTFSLVRLSCFPLEPAHYLFGPFGPSAAAGSDDYSNGSPTRFLLPLALCGLLFLPPSMETPALLIGPVVRILALLLLPFISGEGEKSWRRRPIAVLTILLVAVALETFTRLAEHTPWSPVMDAWSGIPIPSEFLHNRSALGATRRAGLSSQAVSQLPLFG